MNIFVAKLNFSTSTEALEAAFADFGTVKTANVIMDKETGRSKGFGFVEMESDDEAREAIKELDGSDLDGRTIVVKQAEDREKRSSGGGHDRPHREHNNRSGGFGGGGGYDNNRGGGGYDRNDRPRRDSNSNNNKWGRD